MTSMKVSLRLLFVATTAVAMYVWVIVAFPLSSTTDAVQALAIDLLALSLFLFGFTKGLRRL